MHVYPLPLPSFLPSWPLLLRFSKGGERGSPPPLFPLYSAVMETRGNSLFRTTKEGKGKGLFLFADTVWRYMNGFWAAMKILFLPSMTLLKARSLKNFSADTCSCPSLYCVIADLGGKKAFINIDTGQGKGKRGGRGSKSCRRGKTYFHDKCAAGSPQRGFSPLAKHFLQYFRRPSFFCTSTFFATCPLRWVAVYQGSYKKEGGDRHTLSLSFEAPVYSISLGCLVVGNEKWQTNENKEKEHLRSFIKKKEFRSKGKNAFLKKVSCHPVRLESG